MTSPPSFLSCTVKKPSGNSEDCGEMHSVSFSETAGHTQITDKPPLTPWTAGLLLQFCTWNGSYTVFHDSPTRWLVEQTNVTVSKTQKWIVTLYQSKLLIMSLWQIKQMKLIKNWILKTPWCSAEWYFKTVGNSVRKIDRIHMFGFLTKSSSHPAVVCFLSCFCCKWDKMDRAIQKYYKSQKVRYEIFPVPSLQSSNLIHGHSSQLSGISKNSKESYVSLG